MGEPMTLRDEDVGRIGEYVKPWLRQLVDELVPRHELGGAGTQLLERMVRVEEELKAQRTLMDERFGFMARRFEDMFEHMNKRFEESNEAHQRPLQDAHLDDRRRVRRRYFADDTVRLALLS